MYFNGCDDSVFGYTTALKTNTKHNKNKNNTQSATQIHRGRVSSRVVFSRFIFKLRYDKINVLYVYYIFIILLS